MEIVAIPYRCLPCSLQEFTIDGKPAYHGDFGDTEINGDCMEGTCSAQFVPRMPTQKVLDQYGITLEQYAEITEVLKDTIRVGWCGWCS